MTQGSSLISKHPSGCPRLFLAPMEGVGDRPFRKAMATIGGFDEACTEFIRVPIKAHVESLAKVYNHDELDPIPLAAQIMGQDPDLCAKMALELQKRGALRIELNCGCPSNTVTGKGAGSSLLKEPNLLYSIGKAISDVCTVPFSIKMRAGYDDTSLFFENLKAAQDTNASFITLHARTKKDGYSNPANWDLIAQAKQFLSIPLVGNGDIRSAHDVPLILEKTGCDAVMIGRAAIKDPFIFLKTKALFEGKSFEPCLNDYMLFLNHFVSYLDPQTHKKTRINKVKQILSFILDHDPTKAHFRKQMLRLDETECEVFLEKSKELIKNSLFN